MTNMIRSLGKKKALLTVIFLFVLLSIGIAVRAEVSGPYFSEMYPTGEIDISSAVITAMVYCPDGVRESSTYFELDGNAKAPVYVSLFNNNTTAKVEYLATGLTPGSHTVSIVMMDVNNNYNKLEWSFKVKEDASPDRLILVIPSPKGATRSLRPRISVTISGITIDDSVKMRLDGTEVTVARSKYNKFFYTPTSDLSIGDHNVLLRVFSKEGIQLKEVNDWSFTVDPWAIENPGIGSDDSTLPVINYEYSGKQIVTVRNPVNIFDKIKAYDPQGYILGNAKTFIKKFTDSDNQFTEMKTATFVYDTKPSNGTPIFSKGTFNFTFKKDLSNNDGVYSDGYYIIRTQIENEVGAVSKPLDTPVIIRNKNEPTNCTAAQCHSKQPYDHSTRNCDGCHLKLIDPTRRSYPKWPHGPEVFLNPELPSTPVLCIDCHKKSKVDVTAEVYSNSKEIKEHLFIDLIHP